MTAPQWDSTGAVACDETMTPEAYKEETEVQLIEKPQTAETRRYEMLVGKTRDPFTLG